MYSSLIAYIFHSSLVTKLIAERFLMVNGVLKKKWPHWTPIFSLSPICSAAVGYVINSRTLLNGRYCTQCGELLIVFCNGNLTQNSLVEKNMAFKKKQIICIFPRVLRKICSHWTPIMSQSLICSAAVWFQN